MEIPAVATTGFSADWVEGMQAENKQLIETLRFYADRKTYRKQGFWAEVDRDQGQRAREVLKGVVGYE